VPATGVTLKGKADRFDRLTDGRLAIYDYKSGTPPTEKQERSFNQQLWIEALMVEAGGFKLPPDTRVGRIAYIGLFSGQILAHEVDPAALAETAARFRTRLRQMRDPGSGFPSRRSVQELRFAGDYDQLARYGEWDDTQEAVKQPVGDHDG
jgi:ATP-dependent helicase/nuclease subunit B